MTNKKLEPPPAVSYEVKETSNPVFFIFSTPPEPDLVLGQTSVQSESGLVTSVGLFLSFVFLLLHILYVFVWGPKDYNERTTTTVMHLYKLGTLIIHYNVNVWEERGVAASD